MSDFVDNLVSLGICVALPITIVWIIQRARKHKIDKRTEIILAAIEKNANIDIEEFMKKMNPEVKTLKERLIAKLMWGGIVMAVGIGILAGTVWADYSGGMPRETLNSMYLGGAICALIGLVIISIFFISKKMMAKELEAEGEK